MRMVKVLELSGFQEEHKRAMPEGVDVVYTTPSDVTLEQVAEAEVVIGRVPMEMLPYAKKLKWIQLDTAGSETYAKEGVLPDGCILSNATGSFGMAIAEYLLCTILMLMRNMNLYVRNQLQGKWEMCGPISSIYGSTFLIIGMGDLGSEFAYRVQALGGKVLGVRKHPKVSVEGIEKMYGMEQIPDIIGEADVVVLALPSTKETRRSFHKEYFGLMKKTAILANVGRGDVLYTEELLEAVQHKEIAGAILDVCDQEPIPVDHPIWKEENIIITPHISGTFQLPKTYERFVRIALSNLQAYLAGEPLRNVVEVGIGYRRIDTAIK